MGELGTRPDLSGKAEEEELNKKRKKRGKGKQV